MYENNKEFEIIVTDYHCPYKIVGRCNHMVNIDKELQKGFKWCDKTICPLRPQTI